MIPDVHYVILLRELDAVSGAGGLDIPGTFWSGSSY